MSGEKCNHIFAAKPPDTHKGNVDEQLYPAYPTKILFGKGQVAQLREQLPRDARILITYGGGSVVRSGLLAQIRSELAGMTLFEFGGIEPNPTYETLMGAVELARAERVDFLLAVGGGSVLDGTKFIAAAAHYDPARDPWHILETVGNEVRSAIPLGAVLTLPATGSEMNMGAVVTRRSSGDKVHFFSPFVMPRFAVLDPVLTYTLPARQVANGWWMPSSTSWSSTSPIRSTPRCRIASPKVCC